MTRKITLKELKEHTSAKSLWIAIHDQVYDVSTFVTQHPGGKEVLLQQAGGYATDAFELIGHSTDAQEVMETYHIGDMVEADKEIVSKGKVKTTTVEPSVKTRSWSGWIISITFAMIAALIYQYVIVPLALFN